jgi:hypothetical protein
MPILVGVGSSQITDESRAIEEVYSQSVVPLNNNKPSFMLLFASPTTFDQQKLLTALKNKSPDSVIIGCSTSGEITPVGSLDNSVALMSIYSDQMNFVSGIGNDIKSDARESGRALARDIQGKQNGEKPKAGLILPDGLAGNGADIVRGVLDVFGSEFMLAGGAAGDDYLFKQTYEYLDDKVVSGSVVGVGMYGNFEFGIGVRHGWIPIGNPRTVTKSESNILYELDGKPAVEIYEDQFGKDKEVVSSEEPFARLAITYPLGISVEGKDEYLIRDPLTVDGDGAITCAAEIPEGSTVYIMIGSREEAITAAGDAAEKAKLQVEGHDIKAVILFNCIARKKLLMNKKQEEIDKIREVFGTEIPIIGFYTYGEQAPLGGEVVTCSFHNETDVIFVLAE